MSSARATPPTLGRPASLSLPPLQRHALANGLEVLLVERPGLPVVDVQLLVRAGAAGDDARHAGRACLMAGLLDQGTARRTATQIAEETELLGASLHTSGSWDFCAAGLHVLSPRLEPALDLLADVVIRPTFPQQDFERRRARRLAAILQELDEPRVVATHAFTRALYGADHPFGHPLGGSRETVERLTRDDVRAFCDARFTPRDAFVVVVGDVTAAGVLPLLERCLGEWQAADAGAGRAGESAAPDGRPPAAGVGIHVVDRPGAPQSELRIGRAGPPRMTPDYFPLLVANTILGGTFTSRLNMRLREEKAYTYGAGSSIACRAAGGPLLAATAVATAATADAVATVVEELRRLAAEPVPAAELERVRNYIVLGLPRTFETTGDIAEHLAEVALYGLGTDYYARYADRVRSVSAEDVRAAAERWLGAEGLTVVAAGDAAAIRTELEALGIGEVHVRQGG